METALVLAAAGAATGVAILLVRRQQRRRLRLAAGAPAPVTPAEGRTSTVLADDGVPLHVEQDGPGDAAVTVVFCHGFTAQLASWAAQREALGDLGRLVFYDQRGHGRSGPGDPSTYTIDQLGRDLGRVLDAVAPAGPVVLAGHSLGGMTVMALADQQPALFGPRVVGVALLSTSAGRLLESSLRGSALLVALARPLLRVWVAVFARTAALFERIRRRGTWAGYLYTRRYLFGRDDASREDVQLVQAMLEATPLPVVAGFYPSFLTHDKAKALGALAGVPTLVLTGSDDRLLPARNSQEIAEAVGESAELVVEPGAGHSVILTRAARVNAALRALVERATARAAA